MPLAPTFIAIGGHTAALQTLEVTYLRCLCFAALPMLVMAAVNGFFSGRGQTWTVLGIEAAGTGLNVALALVLIFGRAGFPELGIQGAGLATLAGSWLSAVVALWLFFRKPYRTSFNTLRGWLFERDLFVRLMKYGGPAGTQVFLDVLVWNVFVQLVGRLGEAATAATTLTVRLNMVAFLPMMGMGQAVSILVGQRLGADRPDLAERSAYTGLKWSFGFMCTVAALYLFFPTSSLACSGAIATPRRLPPWRRSCPACSSAWRSTRSPTRSISRSRLPSAGAGDTRFVSLCTFGLAWPILVVPTYLVVRSGASVNWAWGFATAHILAMSVCFYLRFRSGRWKTMRVIEAVPAAG